VTRTLEEHRSFYGKDGGEEFFADITRTARGHGGQIVAIFPTQEQFARALGVKRDESLSRLEQLAKYVKVRCLLSDVLHSDLFLPFFEFRAIPRQPLGVFSSLSYGNKTALIATCNADATYIVMVSAVIASKSYLEFAQVWETASPIMMQSKS